MALCHALAGCGASTPDVRPNALDAQAHSARAPAPQQPEGAQPATTRVEEVMLHDALVEELRRVRVPVDAPKRPQELASFVFDHASLPAIPFAAGPPDDSGAFRIQTRPDNGYSIRIVGDLIADIQLGSFRGFTLGLGGSAKQLPTSVFHSSEAPCGLSEQIEHYSWDALKQTGWSDAVVDYFVFDGTFDYRACTATVDYATEVQARAIVPGLVYAYRRCNGDQNRCDDPERSWEQVSLIAPPASWVASSVAPAEQAKPRVGAFTHVTVPLLRGSSASILFTVSVREIAFFQGLHGTAPRWMTQEPNASEDLQLSLEIVWPQHDSEPSGRASALATGKHGAEVLAAVLRL